MNNLGFDLGVILAEKDSKIQELEKQKNQAYAERNKVVAALAHILAKQYINVGVAKHQGEDWEDDWRNVLVIDLPDQGQITWHFHDSEQCLLDGFNDWPDYQWDGHTTEEKYERLLEYALEGFELDF